MATFTDDKGHEWELSLTVGDYKRLKSARALDLDAVWTDSRALADVIYGPPWAMLPTLEVLLKKQMESAGVSVEDFAERMGAESIGRAGEALYRAVADFFQRGRSATLPAESPPAQPSVSSESVGNLAD